MRLSVLVLMGLGLSGCYKTSLGATLDGDEGVEAPFAGSDAAVTGASAPAVTGAGASPTGAGPAPIAVITRPLTYYKDVKPIIEA